MASALRRGLGLLLLLLAAVVDCTTAVDVSDGDPRRLCSSTSGHMRANRPLYELDDVQPRELHSKPFVLVTTANSTSACGVITAVLSPRFLITMATWLTAANSASTSPSGPLFAVSANQTIPVKQVWFERDFTPSDSNNRSSPFTVIELERDALPTVELSTSLPAVESALDVVYLDPVLLRTSEPLKSLLSVVLPSDACNQISSASSSRGGDGVLCVQSNRPQELSKMGFATVSGCVVGIVSDVGAAGQGTPQSFAHFGSAPHKRFLDLVTKNSLKWEDQESPAIAITSSSSSSPVPNPATIPPASSTPSSSPVGPTRVSFFGDDASELICGGVQIASDYILTSASCVLNHNVTRVSFQNGVFAASVPVMSQFVHPSFQLSSNDTTAFDVAVLSAPSQANPASSIVLDSISVPAYISVRRLQLGESSQLQSVQVLPPTSCTTPASNIEGSAVHCVEDVAGTDGTRYLRIPIQSTNAALFRGSSEVSYLAGLQPDTSSSNTAEHFVLVADVASFIDANSVGHTWRKVFHSETDAAYPITAPLANLVTVSSATTTTELAPPLPSSKWYIVGLRLTKTGQNFCGGVLISPLHVLTAANCVADGEVGWAVIGSSASAGDSDEILRVAQGSIVIHPKFGSPYMASNNVAILTLERAAYSTPIAFETAADFADGMPATMTGYGGLSGSSQSVKAVKSVALPVWSKRKCTASLPNVDDSILCAGGDAGKDACTGDADSSLTIQSSSGEDFLIGIVSAGYGCGQEGVPGFYARTASLMKFVKAYTIGTKWSSSIPAKAPIIGTNTTTAPAAIEDQSASSTSLILSKLSPVSQSKVLSFLIGTEDRSNILDKELKTRLSGDLSSITLISSEDLSAVTQVIEKHNALALNRRWDRFGTADAAGEGSSVATSCGV